MKIATRIFFRKFCTKVATKNVEPICFETNKICSEESRLYSIFLRIHLEPQKQPWHIQAIHATACEHQTTIWGLENKSVISQDINSCTGNPANVSEKVLKLWNAKNVVYLLCSNHDPATILMTSRDGAAPSFRRLVVQTTLHHRYNPYKWMYRIGVENLFIYVLETHEIWNQERKVRFWLKNLKQLLIF